MGDLIDEGLAEHEGLQKGEVIEKYSDLIALGRVEEPEDVAAFVSCLQRLRLHDRAVRHDRRRHLVLVKGTSSLTG